MKYFKEESTIEQLKAQYKELSTQYQSGTAAGTKTMKKIDSELIQAYTNLLAGIKVDTEDEAAQKHLTEEYALLMGKIIHLEGVTIELVGHWIWVSGSTYPVKDNLKEAGLYYASRSKAWCFRSEMFKPVQSEIEDGTIDKDVAIYLNEQAAMNI